MNGDNAEEPGPHPTLSQVPSFLRPVGGRTQDLRARPERERVHEPLAWSVLRVPARHRLLPVHRLPAAPQTNRHLLPLLFRNQNGGHQGTTRCVCLGARAGNLSRVGERVRRLGPRLRAGVAGPPSRRTLAVSWPGVRSRPCGCRPRSAGRISTSRRASSACATFPRDVTWRSRPRRIRLWPCPPPRHAGLIFSLPMRPSCPSSARDAGLALHLRGHMPVEAEIGGCAESISFHRASASGLAAQKGDPTRGQAADNSGEGPQTAVRESRHGRDQCRM